MAPSAQDVSDSVVSDAGGAIISESGCGRALQEARLAKQSSIPVRRSIELTTLSEKQHDRWHWIDTRLRIIQSEQNMNSLRLARRYLFQASERGSPCSLRSRRSVVAMLKLIEGSCASFFPKEIDAMFRNRAETFSDRLGWEVEVKDGYERDRFDDANPLYLVSVDPDTEEYWGSLRLLPTTGPNMLRDVFAQLLDGDFIESATIWESSRICATTSPGQPDRSRSGVNYALSELILGIGEVAVAAGLTQIVSVFDARIFRVLRAAGCNPEIIGRPQRIGGAMSYAGLFETGEGPLKTFRAAAGIESSVLAPGAKELAFA
jgi:acyl homoserine lactone synthase